MDCTQSRLRRAQSGRVIALLELDARVDFVEREFNPERLYTRDGPGAFVGGKVPTGIGRFSEYFDSGLILSDQKVFFKRRKLTIHVELSMVVIAFSLGRKYLDDHFGIEDGFACLVNGDRLAANNGQIGIDVFRWADSYPDRDHDPARRPA